MKRLLLATCAVAPLTGAGCWPGWDFLFDVTPSREHRVEDLRVLAVKLEPASIVFTPAFAAGDEDREFALRVQPVLFDPRGGDIDVDISLCVSANDGFSPCSSLPGSEVVRTTVTARTEDPLGIVELDESFTLSRALIVSMFESAGVSPTSIGGINAGVVVNVGRTFNGKRERERAELLFPVEVDPFGAGTSPALFEASGAVDCTGEPEGTCFIDGGEESVCGDGVVEGFEQCDPPEEGVCDEGCFAFDFCQAAPTPVCVSPVAVNTSPAITGALVVDEGGTLPGPESLRVDVGGVIELTPGVPRFVTVESPQLVNPEVFQPAFAQTFCPEGSPGRRTFLECGLLPEELNTRVYIADARAELVGSIPEEGFFGNPQFGGGSTGVMFAADTPSGTREPLVLVLSDGAGGMDLALFTLEAR
jgi:hypothetical protein